MKFDILEKEWSNQFIKLATTYITYIGKGLLEKYNAENKVDMIHVKLKKDNEENKGGYIDRDIFINVDTDNINKEYLKIDLFNTILHEFLHILFPLKGDMKCYEELWIETLVYRYLDKYYDIISSAFDIHYDKKTYLKLCKNIIDLLEKEGMKVPNRKFIIKF